MHLLCRGYWCWCIGRHTPTWCWCWCWWPLFICSPPNWIPTSLSCLLPPWASTCHPVCTCLWGKIYYSTYDLILIQYTCLQDKIHCNLLHEASTDHRTHPILALLLLLLLLLTSWKLYWYKSTSTSCSVQSWKFVVIQISPWWINTQESSFLHCW